MAETMAPEIAEKIDDRLELSPEIEFPANFLSSSVSFRADVKTKKKISKRISLDEDDFVNFLHGSDPVKIELNRLQNEVIDKNRELVDAQAEIKALKLTDRIKEKALEELTEELRKMVEKFQASEAALENKNLEIKRVVDEKKAALAAQFAAEATLRRVHAAQKDEELPPLEAILSPLEAEIKQLRQEVSKLQDDNRALERLTKSKEAALLEAERDVQSAYFKASLVDELQNRNQELMKQIEISLEENKILDKINRQKIAEVEKLGQTVRDLEEALLSGAAAANAVRDYQRQVSELKGEKRTLERTLSRAKVVENRVAVVVANEWKDSDGKVMPVKQWLEERRFLMGEMQQLRDKLSIAERTAKTEAQLKEKFQLRLKVVEDGLRSSFNGGVRSSELQNCSNGVSRRLSLGGFENSTKLSSNSFGTKKVPSLTRSSTMSSTSSSALLKHAKGASKSFDGSKSSSEGQSIDGNKSFSNGLDDPCFGNNTDESSMNTINNSGREICCNKQSEFAEPTSTDLVSGILYDMLQKEVIVLRKASHEKDQSLKDKDDAIEMLAKKVDTLTKAMEVEAKKMRREVAAMEKEVASMRADNEHGQRGRRLSGSSKGLLNNAHMISGRNTKIP
ncbi:microtubule-associated protein 70-2 isoform X1 [Amborella trichopoda]|uniref:Uncharacterized protein n=2 Tax=Amborella trichopoda TaxID=13333 RepID=W1P540_AMBTC|nr:microtubule-associated protein 70-2 isoform X1 [Amborella trichopoda]ERN02085.1 hypothetical protein AMTR_s00045p00152960 [Amborella trichopoda]|eukprot:XP_006840410.3 microtubule-associated protein 70-2 isoform X1 [Amborella trichopoda]